MNGVTVIDHPLVQHKLTLLRDKTRSTKVFRELFNEIGALLFYEVTRDLPLEMVEVETPLAKMKSPKLSGKKLVLAPVGRAGNGFLDGMLTLVPSARVAHVGVYRDPRTLVAVEYFFKAQEDMPAVDRLKESGAKAIRIVCLLATAQAIENVRGHHPDVPIWTAAIDEEITETGYILPGLGDVGDRMYGTR